MNQSATRRLTVILAVIMIVAIGSSAILPLFTNNDASLQNTPAPTATQIATFPPPPQNFDAIKFDQDYLHPSGLFSVGQPTGYTATQPEQSFDGAEISMNNGDLQSVIQVSVRQPATPIKTLDEINALFTTASLNQSWSNYRSSRELSRRKEGDRLYIDFELKNFQQQTFAARQASWTDGEWVYSLRVVTPENATDFLKFMVDKVAASIKPNKIFVGTPSDWKAYFDQPTSMIIRYPSAWTLADSAPGRPASIQADNAILRVETLAGKTVADEAAAKAWLAADRPGATVVSVKPVERAGQKGFALAYTYKTLDGDTQSGLALLLNDANAVQVANLRMFVPDADLNTDAAKDKFGDFVKVMNSFQKLQGVNVPPPPTPTPLPTLTPSPEATAAPEKTAEATQQPEQTAAPEKTAEATQQPEQTPAPEKTAEATQQPTATKQAEATATPLPTPAPEKTTEATQQPEQTASPEATAQPETTPSS
jgi:hypothetical protein